MRSLVVLLTLLLVLLIAAYSWDRTRYRTCRALGAEYSVACFSPRNPNEAVRARADPLQTM